MIKKILLLIVLSVITSTCFADLWHDRISGLCNVASPNAQEIGKYGEVPMDFYTGRANISIPLYNTTQGGVPLNVSLSYDTGGLLINQFPSWTGHGWTLNAGGCITRILQGYYDEDENKDKTVSVYLENYFRNTNQIEGSSIETIANNTTNASTVYDYSPDIFIFNFMGKSGRFFLGHDKKWKVQSNENIKVEFDINDTNNYLAPFYDHYGGFTTKMSKTIKGFTLIDENGVRYKFGGTTDAIEYSIGFFTMETDDWRANSWYLTEIQDRFGNTLYKFTYKRGKFIVQIFNNEFSSNSWESTSFSGFLWGRSYKGTISLTNKNFPFSITMNAPVFLSKIETLDKNVIDFNLSKTICLQEKELYSSFDDYCRKYVDKKNLFYYDPNIPYLDFLANQYRLTTETTYSFPFYYLRAHTYGINSKVDFSHITRYWDQDACQKFEKRFNNNMQIEHGVGWDNPLSVLSFNPLESIKISTKQNGSAKLHQSIKIQYSTIGRLHIIGVNINDKSNNTIYSYKMDYNGYDKIPSDLLTTQFDYWGYFNGTDVNCNANPTTTQYGMMNKLTYPTGGYTVFEYEQNTYSKYVSNNFLTNALSNHNELTGGLRIKSMIDYSCDGKLFKKKEYSYNNRDIDTNKSSGQCYAAPSNDESVELETEYSNIIEGIYMRKGSVIPLTDSYHPHIGYTWVTEIVNGIEKEYKFTNFMDYMDEKPYQVGTSTKCHNSKYNKNSELGFARGNLLSEKIIQDGKTKYLCQYTYNNLDKSLYVSSSTLAIVNGYQLQPHHMVGCLYKLYFPKFDLKKKKETIYNEDGTSMTTITEYNMSYKYLDNNSIILRKCDSETLTRGSDSSKKEYEYLLTEYSDFYFPISKIKTYYNGNLTRTNVVNYSYFKSVQSHILPAKEYLYIGNSKTGKVVVEYNNYDQTGLLTQYTERGKSTVYLQWDANRKLIQEEMTNDPYVSYIKKYEYTPNGYLNKITYPNGYYQEYSYNDLGWLKTISDHKGTIQKHSYNYKNK